MGHNDTMCIPPSILDTITDLQKTEQGKATEANKTFKNNDICLTPGCINSGKRK